MTFPLVSRTSPVEPPAPKPRPNAPTPADRNAQQSPTTVPPKRTWLWFLALLLLNFLVFHYFFPDDDAALTIPYTVFKSQVAEGNVAEIYNQGQHIEGRFEKPFTWPPPESGGETADGAASDAPDSTTGDQREKEDGTALARPQPRTGETFETTLPTFVDPGLEALLIENGVTINARPIDTGGSPLGIFFFGFGPALLLILFYVWLFRRASRQGGGMGGLGAMTGMGKSRARRYDPDVDAEKRVTFDDVAGIDEVESELVEIVDFLKTPEKYTRLGGTAPKGVLLVGAPGTGKTLLARAVAGEAGVPFFSMSAAEFVEMIVGVGAARVRDLFKQARQHAPAILFIDEIDAIGRARSGVSFGGASAEHEQTLNQILTEMDGFSSREGIIVLAATNQPDILDRALLRPGRFDRRLVVNLPDKTGREAILKVHTRKTPLADDVKLDEIAATTPGFSGADIRNLTNEAALLAARRDQEQVHHRDFLDSLEKIILGPERPLLLTKEDRERIAYHEGGHAILGLLVPGADPVHRVTIVPRGQALGVTYQRPDSERYNYPESYLKARIIGMLGGRAAEEIVYGTRTTGAEDDITQATDLARNMVTRWGMSDELGLVQLAPKRNPYLTGSGGFGGEKPFSEETARRIDTEVQRIIDDSHADAKRLLAAHRGALDALAAALLERETLDEQEIIATTGLTPVAGQEHRKLSV